MSGNLSYILVIAIGVIVLAGLTYMNLRKISKSTADLTQLKKRTLLWSEISLALFVLQLFFRDRQGGFLLFFGILTLFTGAHYLGVLYYSKKRGN
ncbi:MULTISPECIES: hypothetical protein [Paenibacillus]|uniref:DUF2178 domain-containing protein n=2 Tax=Paenibacillus TaxID=44249 RepID=A0A1V4HFX4_9BACL|nr:MULTISPECIES: hypothetical protein [Paenibacillus]MEC0229288.1 hypothetical protein [Paenibacillus alba]OPH52980.1 hypothetical protein BC351_32495 [Paenibacillus ferrarius]